MNKNILNKTSWGFIIGIFLGVISVIRSPYIYEGKGEYGIFLVAIGILMFGGIFALLGLIIALLENRHRTDDKKC